MARKAESPPSAAKKPNGRLGIKSPCGVKLAAARGLPALPPQASHLDAKMPHRGSWPYVLRFIAVYDLEMHTGGMYVAKIARF